MKNIIICALTLCLATFVNSCHGVYTGDLPDPNWFYKGEVVQSKCAKSKEYRDIFKKIQNPQIDDESAYYYYLMIKVEDEKTNKLKFKYIRVDEEAYQKYNYGDTIK